MSEPEVSPVPSGRESSIAAKDNSPEPTHYTLTMHCLNCHLLQVAHIPKGTEVFDYTKSHACQRCGVYRLRFATW